jgi:hypothetical protein
MDDLFAGMWKQIIHAPTLMLKVTGECALATMSEPIYNNE